MNSVSPVCHAVKVCWLSCGDMNLIRFGQQPEGKTRTHSDCIRNEKRYRIRYVNGVDIGIGIGIG